MQARPRSRYLTHAYPMWRGCTLKELMLLGGGILASFSVMIALSSLCFSFWGLLAVVGVCVVSAYPLGWWVLKRFAAYKKGKPPHFVMLDIAKRLGLGQTLRLSRVGAWETRRTFVLETKSK